MLHDDVIIRAAVEDHSEIVKLIYTNSPCFFWSKTRSMDTAK